MFNLNKIDRKILFDILSKFPFTFYAFGSRITKNYKKFSDIDLYINENISDLDLFYLKEACGDSNLSVKVDIKRIKDMSPEFFELIKEKAILLIK